jgi:hypothetical protein
VGQRLEAGTCLAMVSSVLSRSPVDRASLSGRVTISVSPAFQDCERLGERLAVGDDAGDFLGEHLGASSRMARQPLVPPDLAVRTHPGIAVNRLELRNAA